MIDCLVDSTNQREAQIELLRSKYSLFESFRACLSTEGLNDAPMKYAKLIGFYLCRIFPTHGVFQKKEYKLISHADALQWFINTSFVLPHAKGFALLAAAKRGCCATALLLFLDVISVQVGYWTLACSRRFQLLSSMPICYRLLL